MYIYQITRSVRESVSNQSLWMTVLRDAAQIYMYELTGRHVDSTVTLATQRNKSIAGTGKARKYLFYPVGIRSENGAYDMKVLVSGVKGIGRQYDLPRLVTQAGGI